MNTKIFFFLFFLTLASYLNAKPNYFLIEGKDFVEVKQIIEKHLSTKSYKVEKTDDKLLEIYFDTPELFYLRNEGYIRYKAVEYFSKKKKVKYKENIEYALSNNNQTFSVKHYNSVKTFEEKHPLLSLVKRKERQAFLDKLKNDGIEYPMRLKKVVHVSKFVQTYVINTKKDKLGIISIYKVKASAYESEIYFTMLKIDIVKNKLLIDDLKNILDIKDEKKISHEYFMVFEQMEKNVGLFYWILRYPYLVNLLYAMGFGIFGLLIVFVLFKKRLISKYV